MKLLLLLAFLGCLLVDAQYTSSVTPLKPLGTRACTISLAASQFFSSTAPGAILTTAVELGLVRDVQCESARTRRERECLKIRLCRGFDCADGLAGGDAAVPLARSAALEQRRRVGGLGLQEPWRQQCVLVHCEPRGVAARGSVVPVH